MVDGSSGRSGRWSRMSERLSVGFGFDVDSAPTCAAAYHAGVQGRPTLALAPAPVGGRCVGTAWCGVVWCGVLGESGCVVVGRHGTGRLRARIHCSTSRARCVTIPATP